MSFIEGQNKEINQLKKRKLLLNISRRIVWQNSFVGAVVSGQRQSGKSSYMMLILYELYNHDWKQVFNHIFYDMESFTTFLMSALETGVRVPAVALDDAGVHFGAQQYNTHRNQVTYVSALLDTIGIISKSIILTVPNSDNLIKAIRSANFYKIEIHQGRDRFIREAHGYLMHTSPKGQIYPTKEFLDRFDTRIPTYEEYSRMRYRYSVDTLKSLESFLGKKKQGVFVEGGKKYTNIDIEGDEY